eukprot:TRINITY_DN4194_c0_g1_i1.p1 TRINITY_DN4194_c0_g1~~TRINITY_DN4194_c0_g1_i1.p1  ORF type:complete len:387 (-),score=67.13 TRINITY_DN4194_c0_g1_i1:4-1134(-)
MSRCVVLLSPVIAVGLACLLVGLHSIDEGHVGMYWVGGALGDDLNEPGYHFMLPFLTTMAQVQVTLQTDTVTNIPCGTSGGSIIYFDKVEVVNQLRTEQALNTIRNYGVNYDKTWIFDKIHHEINQFCSSHSLQEVYIDQFDTLDEALQEALQQDCTKYNTGIDIISVRVTKPRIPPSVAKNYEKVEEEKTRLKVATQHQAVVKKEEETLRLQAKIQAELREVVSVIQARKEAAVESIEAQKLANVSRIRVEMQILEKEAEQRKSFIENDISLTRSKALASAKRYRIETEASANKLKFTPEYMKFVLYKSLGSNPKSFFGKSTPSIFLDWLQGSDAPELTGLTTTAPSSVEIVEQAGSDLSRTPPPASYRGQIDKK